MNQSSMGWTAWSLIESVLTLYPANADGTPDLDSPVWSGVPAQNLRVADRWIKVETRPTGAAYPKKHPLLPQFEISIERVWALYLDNLEGIIPDENTYVLDIVWTDEDSGNWHRETFYGVTIGDRNRASKNEDGGFTEELAFDAQYYIRDGGQGSAPAIAATLPMQIVYVDASGVSLPLYNYNPANQTFSETQSGVSASRAIIAYTPDANGPRGTLQIEFIAAGYPILWLDETGATWTFNLVAGAPTRSVVPRLDFYIGTDRVASLDAKGALYHGQFFGNPPAAQSSAFQFFSNNALQLTLDGLAARANGWHLFNPTDVTGLKCWLRAENLADLDDGEPVESWPDESGNGNDLALAPATGLINAVYWNLNTATPAQPAINPFTGLVLADLSRGDNTGTSPVFLSSTSHSAGYTTAAGFAASGGDNAAVDAASGALNLSSSTFFSMALTLSALPYSITLTNVSFGSYSTSSGPTTLSLYASSDGFVSNFTLLGQVTVLNNSTWAAVAFANLSLNLNPGQTSSLRVYGSGGTGIASSGNWRMDDLAFVIATSLSPSAPTLAENAVVDLVTQETLVGGQPGPAVLLQPGNALVSAASAFNPDTHCIFAVAFPFGFAANGGLLGSGFLDQPVADSRNGNTYTNSTAYGGQALDPDDFFMSMNGGKFQGMFAGETILSGALTPGWYLLEQEANISSFLKSRINGADVAAATFTGTTAGMERPVQLGDPIAGFFGYVKSVLIYEGNPTDEQKFWLRLFLNNAYEIF